MGFIDENGELVGFDIDVAREVCSRLGIKLSLCGIDWNEKENLLNDGTIDCIWNGLSITPVRAETMDLSEPYMKNELIIVVSGKSTVKVQDDLKGGKIGVQSGSTAEEALEKIDIYSDITSVTFDNVMQALQKLDDTGRSTRYLSILFLHFIIFFRKINLILFFPTVSERKNTPSGSGRAILNCATPFKR